MSHVTQVPSSSHPAMFYLHGSMLHKKITKPITDSITRGYASRIEVTQRNGDFIGASKWGFCITQLRRRECGRENHSFSGLSNEYKAEADGQEKANCKF